MPAMSGVQLQSHLRLRGCRLPFLFITAVPTEKTRKQALDDGAICFLTKPFDEETLIGCLDVAIAADIENEELLPDRSRCRLHVASLGHGFRIVRGNENGNCCRFGQDLAQQLQSLCP